MPTIVEYTDDFGQWYSELTEIQQDDIASVVDLLEAKGTSLGFPYSSKINSSKLYDIYLIEIQQEGLI
jgi:hypothetical protein